MKIFKYRIPKDRNAYGNIELEMNPVKEFLDVKEIDREVFLWAIVDENQPKINYKMAIVRTGDPVLGNWSFIKTFHQTPFVWHLFLL